MSLVALVGCSGASTTLRASALHPPTPATIDGRPRLVYEIVLHNDSGGPLEIVAVAADAGPFGRVRLDGKPLVAHARILGEIDHDTLSDLRKSPPPAARPHAARADELWLSGGADAPLPTTIAHQVEARDARRRALRPATVAVPVRAATPLVLGPPLAGRGWIPFQTPGDESPHRRSILKIAGRRWLAQRFAIDWGRVDASGRFVREGGDKHDNASYAAYGGVALAVADGTVVAVRDGLPDNRPADGTRATPILLDTVAGNYVILDLGGERYALYAHLQAGSLRVAKGERVRCGQPLGLVGNSGNSTAPHLHVHVCDAPAPLTCEGQPYVIDRFARAPATLSGEDEATGRALPAAAATSVERDLVGGEALVDFPE
jgi:murein DD-endopeptidase MepM/ murein hydrolase activator NlpD